MNKLIEKFKSRIDEWKNNGPEAWVHVKLGEMRAIYQDLEYYKEECQALRSDYNQLLTDYNCLYEENRYNSED